MIGKEPPLVLVIILVVLAIVVVLAVVRIILLELQPSEIDLFQQASSLTSAWARGEEWPPAYPDEPGEDQRSSTPRQGLPRNSAT